MSPTRRHITGYAFGLAAGVIWGTTGPLSTALYAEGAALTGIGFWRILLGTLAFAAYGLGNRDLFRIDRRGLLLVGGLGGALVALFEVAYQRGIAGAGVAGAAALLYLAPVAVAVLAKPILGEELTPLRLALALVVMVGAWLTVRGGHPGLSGVPVTGHRRRLRGEWRRRQQRLHPAADDLRQHAPGGRRAVGDHDGPVQSGALHLHAGSVGVLALLSGS